MMVHVRFEGKSYDFRKTELDVQPGASDLEILNRLSHYMDVAPTRFDGYVVDRPATGDRQNLQNLIIRPEAVYG